LIPVGFSVDRLIAWQDQPANAQPAGAQPAAGQTANAQPSFSTDVSVVNVLVNVRDKQGKIVHDLTKDDFTIDEDGRPQAIKYFAQQSGTPLTLGLLVDTSESQRRLIDQERSASRDFLQHVLREDQDKAFLIHFDREVELLQDLTSSRKELNVALDQVESSRPQLNRRDSGGSQDGGGYPQSGGGYPGGGNSGGGQGGRSGRGGGGTTLYDAILLGSDEIMKKQQGRKAMIVLSDGVDHGSRVTLNEAIESAQKADTLVYAIRFADTQSYGNGGGFGGMGGGGMGGGIGGIGGMGGGRRGGGNRGGGQQAPRVDGKKILEQIARETGGAYFDVSSKMPLDKIYDRIEEDLRNQYSLGYSPDQPSGGYHKIKVTTKAKNAVLLTREGYYGR